MVRMKSWGVAVVLAAGCALHVSAQDLVRRGEAAISAAEVKIEVGKLDESVRTTQYIRPEVVRLHASNMLVRRVLAQEAQQAELDKDPAIAFALRQARERILSDAMLARIDERNKPSDAVVESYARSIHAANPKRFETPEQVRVRHILIRGNTPDAEPKAAALLAQLKQGASFEALAKEQSADPGSATRGGDLGFTPRGRMVKPFEDAAFALTTPGQLSDVVKTQFGFHVLQLVEKKPVGTRPFDEVKAQLLKEAQAGVMNEGRIKEQDRIWADAQYNDQAIEDVAKWAAQR